MNEINIYNLLLSVLKQKSDLQIKYKYLTNYDDIIFMMSINQEKYYL